tara:strand:- start:2358 stop:2960 length:603 start_codon:yes stop_codon:yes gene_type:complete
MKIFFTFIVLGFLLATPSCRSNYKSDIEKLQDNDMNFPNLTKYQFEDISYLRPELLEEKSYNDDNTISELSESYTNYDLSISFSTELFNASSIDVLQYSSDSDDDDLNTLHDHHIRMRENSLNEFTSSIKKKLPSKIGRQGYIQVIHGNTYNEGEDTSYFVATLEVNGECYVFQLIGIRSNMGYLYDDFLDILSSIELNV